MGLGKYRQRPDRTVFSDVMLALSVLLTMGLLFWIWLFFSTVPQLPHYPRPGLGAFWAHWAEDRDLLDQPLVMFTAVLFLLSAWLFILFITSRRSGRRRLLSERTAMGAGFILIVGMLMATDDLIDIVTGEYRLDKWDGTPLGAPPFWLLTPIKSIYPGGDPDARSWAQIGDREVFLADADTIWIGARGYRLWGIDALQTEQLCATESDRRARCGFKAREAFLELMTSIPPSRITCIFPDQARYPQTISCRAGGIDVADWLVRKGYAFPTSAGQYRYRQALEEARSEKRGAWGTTFLYPWQWKDARCQILLGACRKHYRAD